jgi:biotin carboxylase
MKKLAILGASYLQVPLIVKAKELGIETHVFAWEEGAVGKELADYFYPISILNTDEICNICQKININGITAIATDIAMPTVNFIAEKLGLVGNPLEATLKSTDKFEMRKALKSNGIPCPGFVLCESNDFENREKLIFPLIVKPTDRSGSRGVTKVWNIEETNIAIMKALENSIVKRAIVEEFIDSDKEVSVEFISFKGIHYPLAITDKVSTRDPYFVEIAHHQPANLDLEVSERIYDITKKVLDTLGIKNGASHTELYVLKNGDIRIVESAGRMGGDLIGSHLVALSTGFDFLTATIDVALNQFEYSKYIKKPRKPHSGIYYVVSKPGTVNKIINNGKEYEEIVLSEPLTKVGDKIMDLMDGSDKRSGIIVYSSNVYNPIDNPEEVIQFVMQ